MKLEKYNGVLPAFYACYDDYGEVSAERTKAFAKWLIDKGIHGLYLTGSSGECIYQNIEERKLILESVMEVAIGKTTVIAHVAANSTRDSKVLAAHAENCGVDAIAAIPPIYFHLPEHSIAQYWNDISAAAPNTDFIIYNIPQLAGVALTKPLLKTMLENPQVVAVKNSSMPVQDIEIWKSVGGKDFVVFNGPDEQFVSGLAMGANGGIGGTYAPMTELFLAMYKLLQKGDIKTAQSIQYKVNEIIEVLVSGYGNMYAVIKGVLRLQGIDIGSVRAPLAQLSSEDTVLVEKAYELIESAKKGLVK